VDPPSPAVVEAFRRGDTRAAELVLAHAYALALRTAAAVLVSRRDAADVAQEVALIVWERRRGLRDPERLDAWVHRITVRAARRALTARRRRQHREHEVARALGCRPGTAAALLSRARAALRAAPELADRNPNRGEEHDARRAVPTG